jgi:hypothetical protein
MIDTLPICLGKTGDLITLLPLLKMKAADGPPIPLMVSKDYAAVLEGVSYINPVIFDGGVNEIERAFKEAQKLASKVTFAQVCGPPSELKKCVLDPRPETPSGKFRGSSFQLSLWDCMGHFADFNKGWPLVFDRRNPEREKALKEKWMTLGEIEKKRNAAKLILVSTGRQPGKKPSPTDFKYKDLLMLVLKLAFRRGYRVIDLDEVVAERIYDLLALYEEAHAIVATDNAPLHLTYAVSKLPVLALCSDKPQLWNGSAWRPSHIWHSRYADFPERVSELVEAIEGINSVSSFPWQRKIEGPKNLHVWSQYEVNDDNRHRHQTAVQSWQSRYQTDGNWISCAVERGALGFDSEHLPGGSKFEGGRYPFVKSVLGLAAQRAKPDDTIVLTRAETCLNGPMAHGYSYRTIRTKNGDRHSPWIDLISFPRRTLDRVGELPDLVMGPDQAWAEVVANWAGVPEVENAVWRAE